MRMRRKSWARPELAASDFYIQEPAKHRGAWKELFADPEKPRHLELGCGKGVSTAQMVHENRDVNYVAIDLISDVLATARRNISEIYGDEPVDNVLITSQNVLNIRSIFAPEDAFERIIISFCNPWNGRPRHWKRRLTHTQQLMQYREFLTERGEICKENYEVPIERQEAVAAMQRAGKRTPNGTLTAADIQNVSGDAVLL